MNVSLEDAEYFRRLLNIYHAVPQRDGKYQGRRIPVDPAHIQRHLNGEITLAFCVSTKYETGSKRWARFVAIDVDKNFCQRLTTISSVLNELGISQAAFVTGGSSPDKGKVVITFAKMVDREEAHALARLVHSEAHRVSPNLIPEKPALGDFELFPKRPVSVAWDGGLVRILGRNAGRNGPLENALDFEGRPLDLRLVNPLTQSRVSKLAKRFMVANRERRRPPWVDSLVKQAWTWTCFGGVKQMRSKMYALACYFLTAVGEEAGQQAYVSALGEVKAHSPDLDNPSPTHKDKRNPVGREIIELGAWRAAVLGRRWEPLDFEVIITSPGLCYESNDNPACSDVPDGAKRTYSAMVKHVRTNGLRPHCFGIDQRTLGGMLGITQPATAKALDLAERYGLLVCLHPGTSNSEIEPPGTEERKRRRSVKAGVPGMYGLVGNGETGFDVFSDAIGDGYLVARRLKYPVQTIMPEVFAIFGRLVVEHALGNIPPLAEQREAA